MKSISGVSFRCADAGDQLRLRFPAGFYFLRQSMENGGTLMLVTGMVSNIENFRMKIKERHV
jgi:hypothetical protein